MNKTISFAVVHFSIAFGIGYVMTGSMLVGGAIALVEPFVNSIAYHIHEKVWNRIQRGRDAGSQQFVQQV